MDQQNIEEGRRDCPLCDGSNTLNVTYENDKLLLECHRCVITDRGEWFKQMLAALGAQSGTNHQPPARKTNKPKRTYTETSKLAQYIDSQGTTAKPDGGYLVKKGNGAHGLNETSDGKLIVPLHDETGVIVNVQLIESNGQKRFLKDGQKKGCSYLVDGMKPLENDEIHITEGVSTGFTVKESMPHGTCVAVCFDCGNLLPAGESLLRRFPGRQLIFCADNDLETEGNPGMTNATDAARLTGGKICSPKFQNYQGKETTDFNDLHQREGLEVVRAQIEAAKMLEAEPEEHEDEEKEDPLIPEQAKVCLPSAMQEIVKTLEDCSQTPPDIISLFLPVFTIPFLEGTVLKKSDNDPGRPPRLPVTVIGPSGSGKTTPLERTRVLYQDLEDTVDADNKERIKTIHYLQAKLKKEKDPFQISNLHAEIDENRPLHKVYQTQTGSRQGLCRALGDGSNPLIILDEIGRFISRASKGGPESDNMDCITELADQGCIRPPLLKGTIEQGPTKTIYGVSFGLYGTTTIEDLPQKKAASLLKGGFFSRQIMGVIDEVKGFPEKNYLTENELHQLRLWRDSIIEACRLAEYAFIMDDDAKQVFRQYCTKISQKFVISGNSHEHHAGQIIRRVKQAEDVCLIFHCSDPETNRNKYVEGLTATLATLFVDYFHERHHPKFLRFIEHGEEVTTRHAIGERVLKYLQLHDGKAGLRDIYRGLHLRGKVATRVVQHLVGKKLVAYENQVVSIL